MNCIIVIEFGAAAAAAAGLRKILRGDWEHWKQCKGNTCNASRPMRTCYDKGFIERVKSDHAARDMGYSVF